MNEQIKYYQDKLNFEWDSADLFTQLDKGTRPIQIIDTRSESAFQKEHIPNAVHFPHRTINEDTVSNLDRDVLYICYCDGIGCNGSTKGAMEMAKLGFKVRELIGGLDWWKRDGYETQGTESTPTTSVRCAC